MSARLKRLAIKDRALFNRFLGLSRHELSVYAFENIYIWKALFDIYWKVIRENLCIFFQDKAGCFAYTAPLGTKLEPRVIEEIFKIADSFNRNKDISRIENIEREGLPFYQGLGLKCRLKSVDYLCKRLDLVELKGNRFKSKRACLNYFTKHYKFEYLPYSVPYRNACLDLYDTWARERNAKSKDKIYRGMLSDSRACLEILLKDYRQLDLAGRLIKIGKEIKAFTFGFKLSPDTFCILYEVTDLSVKGAAQFIFQRFCAELKDYKYINIMDDSGLENLKKVKLSYHPAKLCQSFTVTRGNG